MSAMKRNLPIDAVLPDLIAALRETGAAVLQAPTGTGKTTGVPPALLDASLLGDGQLLLLQPRRVAARACAKAMAGFRGERVGETIGYQIRFERKASAKTRIMVVTEGILTARFASDSLLEGVSCVVLDEFHERSQHTDLALAILRELREIRDDLKLVVMSATLDAQPVADFLGHCPVITAKTRKFPLDIRYQHAAPGQQFAQSVGTALNALMSESEDDRGHVLVFLPGAPEIYRTKRELPPLREAVDVVPLHGGLSSAEQDAALAAGQQRRVILATNIAETSLTIPGVTAVVDTGYHKQLQHDQSRGVDRLETVRISKASADQRAGRAGRTGPGRVIRLWDETRQQLLIDHDLPEIARIDLAPLLLKVLDFHGPDLERFRFFQQPPAEALARARDLLRELGAIDRACRLTALGKHLNAMPLHPRLGRMLAYGAERGVLAFAARLAALVNERDFTRETGDLTTQMSMLTSPTPEGDARTVQRIRDGERQLLNLARKQWPKAEMGDLKQGRKQLGSLVLAGFPDRLAVSRSAGSALMVGGRGIVFETGGHRLPDNYLVALALTERGVDRTAAKADRFVPVSLPDIRAVLPLDHEETAVFDDERQAVDAVRRTRYEDLVLVDKPVRDADPANLAEVLAQAAAANFDQWFAPSKADLTLIFRLRFAAKHLPEADWPDCSQAGIIAALPEICYGLRKFDQLRKFDWSNWFKGRLDYVARHWLDRHAPERLTVPSGSRVAIDYGAAFEAAGYPVLAVRIQEMFGLEDNPRIAEGKVPLLLHLLAPNMRPAQVTQDLAGFWRGSYADVRKDLRARYPKHAWPEDPINAKPMRGAKRRKPSS